MKLGSERRNDMAEEYTIVAKVISQKGYCEAGQKVGQEFTIIEREGHAPQGMCVFALTAIYSLAAVLRYGGSFPWGGPDPDRILAACPDPINPVVYELRRLRK